MAPAPRTTCHPAFSNLFVQTEIATDRHAILCTRRPRSPDEHAPWMFHLMAVHGAHASAAFVRDRPRAIHRPRQHAGDARRRCARPAPLSGSQGSVLDPDRRPSASRIALEPEQTAIIDMVSGVADTREAAWRWSSKYQDRASPTACSSSPGRTARSCCARSTPPRPMRSCTRASPTPSSIANASLRADADVIARNRRGQSGAVGLRDFRRPADRAVADRRRSEHRPGAPAGPGACLLAPERAGRRPRDLERGSRRLPAAAAGPDHRADRGTASKRS